MIWLTRCPHRHLVLLIALAAACFAARAAELGVYRWDAPGGPANVDAFARWLGRPVQVAAAFEARATWQDIRGAAWQLGPWAQWVRAQPGRNLSLAVPMLPASGASLASCAAGEYDHHWTALAHELAYYGLHWAYLRLGWEMDGTWYAWSAAPGSGREAAFAACFRRMVLAMRAAQPANQWKFVLNTATNWRSRTYLEAVWPGDAYVDLVGIDLYDQSWALNTYPYPATCDAACRLTRQQTAWNQHLWYLTTVRDFAVARGKAMAIPEWGVAIRPDGHGGGDNPYFVQRMHEFIAAPGNYVAYHAYWNVSAGDIDGRLTEAVTGDNPSGPTRFPESATTFARLFGMAAPDRTPPSVALVSPPAGTVIRRRTSVRLEAEASDNAAVSSVEFRVDGARVCMTYALPYRCSWYSGSSQRRRYTITAIATDGAGNAATISRIYDGTR